MDPTRLSAHCLPCASRLLCDRTLASPRDQARCVVRDRLRRAAPAIAMPAPRIAMLAGSGTAAAWEKKPPENEVTSQPPLMQEPVWFGYSLLNRVSNALNVPPMGSAARNCSFTTKVERPEISVTAPTALGAPTLAAVTGALPVVTVSKNSVCTVAVWKLAPPVFE